ncbi:hypothetical protein C0J52_24643 [Blattella germanica]|nr:hypothetical protein C0J52_24643 [Blattella germanica]
METPEDASAGNTKEDWEIFEILCKGDKMEEESGEMSHDVTTSLRSDIAALQYKRDRLLGELQEMKGQLRSRDQRALELQVETEQLREQAARQNAVIASLKKRIHTLQRENHYQEDRVKDLEKKVRALELECNSEEAQRKAMQEIIHRLSTTLGSECSEAVLASPEGLVHKASELVQETSRMRTRSCTLNDTLSAVEAELRTCREALERAIADRDSLQRQTASHLLELDRLRQEKECLEMQHRQMDNLKEKVAVLTQQLNRQCELQEQATSRALMLQDEKSILESRIQKMEADVNEAEVSRDGLRRDKSTTSAVYQLQRRVRTLREQLQRRDLHLDLLRRKLALHDENGRVCNILETERDEANLRVKKVMKQMDRLQLQLAEAKAHARDLKTQLADAADYKIAALERGRKVEELQKRLVESEMLRTRYNRKVALLKDQVRTTSQTAEQERSLNDHSIQLLRDELAGLKQSLLDCQRRENSLQSFRTSVSKLLAVDGSLPDFELVSRLQKLVHAHRDFTLVSRRYDDPLLLRNSPPMGGSRTPMMLGPSPGGTRTPRYDDSGFVDPPDLSTLEDSDEVNGIYNKRPIRTST